MPNVDPNMTRRCVLIASAASLLQTGTLFAATEPVITVHRDPNCGCSTPANWGLTDESPENPVRV